MVVIAGSFATADENHEHEVSMSATFTLSFPEADIAQLTLDMPEKGANVLSRAVLEELDAHLNELEKRMSWSKDLPTWNRGPSWLSLTRRYPTMSN